VMQNCDVVIDFSQADAIAEIRRVALEHSKPLVIGTTGQSKSNAESLKRPRSRCRSCLHLTSASESMCSSG
jgi:dihydrodipicolinate reductase